MTYNGKILWWRCYGHRGGKTYEVGESAGIGRGRKIIRRNIGHSIVDESKLLKELAGAICL